jgi:hypothetical protein
MFTTPRLQVIWIFLTIVAVCSPATAHNLFVMVEPRIDGPDSVDVIFEHSPYPGTGTYNQPLLDRGATWIQRPSEQRVMSLSLQEVTRLGKKFLQAETETDSPRAVVHSCKWGVYKGRLDYFHGKYLDVSSAEQLSRLARTPKLPLDISPAIESGEVKITVFFKDKPLAKTAVWRWTPGGKETKLLTDADGTITVESLAPGIHSFAALHILEDPSGEFEGEPYKGVMHGTTCSFRWPIQ